VTAIELDPLCPAAAPAGKRLLRFEVDAQASQAFQFTPPATALLLDNWAVETDDGALHQDLQVVDACSPDSGVFIRPIAAGSHPRDSVVVIAPSRATWLWLQYEKTPYRWPVRPPV